MIAQRTEGASPWSDLAVLLAWTLACTFIIQLVVLVLGALLGADLTALVNPDTSGGSRIFDYAVLASGSIGTFLIPAYIFQRIRPSFTVFPSTQWTDWKAYLFGLGILLSFGPCMSLLSDWNMQMTLPESMKGIERWMRAQEDSMARITENVVMVSDWNRLILNILVIGVLPAISEELFFRGALQQIFARAFKSEHLAVWVVAILFSAIHFQFYGFLPRFLLGLFFGYVVLWTRNIWIAVFAHFVNNTSVVVLAFYYASQNKSYSELMKSDSYPIFMYIGSLLLSMGMAYLFYQYAVKKRFYGKRLG
ncbi:MAG TPA: CPBP family intramembrane glutamic endopeptidase [Sphingobacterium sp.]|nr:CPBP family intramembrane glutamic endopeptidase [Sphingobacterium sp.]